MPRWLVRAAVMGLLICLPVACAGPTEEDRRRIEILAGDTMHDLELSQLTPTGTVSTVVGHGEGPTLTPSEATRTYTSQQTPDELLEPLIAAVETAGWEISSNHDWGDTLYVIASREAEGFGQSLDVHVRATPEGSEVRITASADAAAAEGHS